MKENGAPYSLMYGTLLGAVREKGFIPHDCDVDLAVWADEDYSSVFEQLEKEGFKKKRTILVDGGSTAKEFTFSFHSIHVDFFFFFPESNGNYYGVSFYPQDGCRNWKESLERFGSLKILRFRLPISKQTIHTKFEDKEFPITVDAEAFLAGDYGPNWRIPDPTFVYPRKGELVYEELSDKKTVITEF